MAVAPSLLRRRLLAGFLAVVGLGSVVAGVLVAAGVAEVDGGPLASAALAAEALEVEDRPLGTRVRLHLRDGRAAELTLLGVPSSRARAVTREAGLPLRQG